MGCPHLGYDPLQRKHSYVTRRSNSHARIEMRVRTARDFALVLFRLVNPFTFTPHGNPKWSSKARFLEDPGPLNFVGLALTGRPGLMIEIEVSSSQRSCRRAIG
jgi:hypothetical protein